jgi:hypothetical protein
MSTGLPRWLERHPTEGPKQHLERLLVLQDDVSVTRSPRDHFQLARLIGKLRLFSPRPLLGGGPHSPPMSPATLEERDSSPEHLSHTPDTEANITEAMLRTSLTSADLPLPVNQKNPRKRAASAVETSPQRTIQSKKKKGKTPVNIPLSKDEQQKESMPVTRTKKTAAKKAAELAELEVDSTIPEHKVCHSFTRIFVLLTIPG